ncbi:pilus assembly protein TadE [Trinickia symbiotica]|uniref:Pilus assembly protein TadE n=2 Tax=Trinickia symbiotica TaxID=863227 RepID=A0A2T3XQD4_9BURK|nr:pilus assembly protein TadE [Trinickia symbiotica]
MAAFGRQHAVRPRAHASSRAAARQRGAIAIWMLFMLAPLLMFGAFAVDVPRVFSAANELQNAADAAALTGAATLSTGTSGPNWSGAATSATAAIPLNKSDGTPLSTGTVVTGYWDLAASSPAILPPSTVALPPAATVVPAVKVTIVRSASSNGLIALLLGALLGMPTTTDHATAVAVVASPSTIPAGALFPVVLDECVYNQYWNSATNQPVLDSSGNPYEFEIGNGQLYGGTCYAGQWTSFLTSFNNVPTVRELITSGNPSPISIGDDIWLQPGVKDTIYTSVPTNVTVLMPVASQIYNKSYVPVVAFAAFHIDGSYGGSSKYIQGHFVGGFKIPAQASGIGPNFGGYVAPRLAY